MRKLLEGVEQLRLLLADEFDERADEITLDARRAVSEVRTRLRRVWPSDLRRKRGRDRLKSAMRSVEILWSLMSLSSSWASILAGR